MLFISKPSTRLARGPWTPGAAPGAFESETETLTIAQTTFEDAERRIPGPSCRKSEMVAANPQFCLVVAKHLLEHVEPFIDTPVIEIALWSQRRKVSGKMVKPDIG